MFSWDAATAQTTDNVIIKRFSSLKHNRISLKEPTFQMENPYSAGQAQENLQNMSVKTIHHSLI